jgi:hypothetical protein
VPHFIVGHLTIGSESFSGIGSHARRIDHIRQRLSRSDLFSQLGKIIKDAQWAATESITEDIRNGLQTEFDSFLLDIQSVLCEENEMSESQRYPEVASRIQHMVDSLAQSLE